MDNVRVSKELLFVAEAAKNAITDYLKRNSDRLGYFDGIDKKKKGEVVVYFGWGYNLVPKYYDEELSRSQQSKMIKDLEKHKKKMAKNVISEIGRYALKEHSLVDKNVIKNIVKNIDIDFGDAPSAKSDDMMVLEW